jgi:sorting nexin-4
MGVSAMGRRVQESSRSVARGSRHGRRAPLTASSPCALIMLGDDEDVFDSVTWETAKPAAPFAADDDDSGGAGAGPGFRQSADDDAGRDPHEPRWEGFLTTAVRDPTKELAETKDAYVSYLVAAEVRATRASVCCANKSPTARRRYKDFVFLRENLVKDFPACVVPPLPSKQRMGEREIRLCCLNWA